MISEKPKSTNTIREDIITLIEGQTGIVYNSYPDGFLADVGDIEDILIDVINKVEDRDYMPQGEPVE